MTTDTDEVHKWLARLERVPHNGAFTVYNPPDETEIHFITRISTYAKFLSLRLEWTKRNGKHLVRVTKI
jgi:hypothetical protein